MSNERQQRAARAEQMRKEREKADRKQRNVITIAIVAVVIVLIGVGGYAIKSTSDKNSTVSEVIQPANSTKDYSVLYSTKAVTGTAATNPVTVTAYEDFQCPACRSFEEQSGAFLADLVDKGEVTMEYRPISFLDDSSNGNKYSSRSGSAAMCVLDKGGIKTYKKMHDILYANQPKEGTNGLPDTSLLDFAKQAGVTGIDACIKSEKYVPWLDKATQASRDAKVSATPTILVNGKTVASPTVANLQKAIAAAKKA
ncbi:thioredoxin domain-containing protein [Aeromicrobium sp.]|uniref:DsbA family protein n=1 Tax=Aeromicrobium sp. TaxID=1871063 RepID=UPI0019BEC858|nr:thioredoxin domain-containing protein [Aeromicrobium sp.]MBC7631786.1 thioredoxin domain-containing protein [Aeromicrobium sp.]